MNKELQYHVLHHKGNYWCIMKEKNDDQDIILDGIAKGKARREGIKVAKDRRAEFYMHDKSGKLVDYINYSK